MNIRTKRIYDLPSDSDGYRVLVDRLWPRGMSKGKANIDLWLKDAAPSNDLRIWYAHDPSKWDEFRQRYFTELDGNRQALEPLIPRLGGGRITLLFSSKETRLNNATALREYLLSLADTDS